MKRYLPFLLVALLWGAAGLRDAGARWVENTVIPPLVLEHSTEVRDRNGVLLRAYTVADGRWRLPVTLAQVDPAYVDLLLTYEDRRFHTHAGVDARAMLRAAWQAVRNGQVVSGGSTLTMQVARLLEDGTTGRWAGKMRQIRLALALEQRLSKETILTLYLNLAPYGGNLEGIRAASLAYLGKEPLRLTPAEAALLVALPQSPEARRPDRFPNRAEAARERVLLRGARFGLLDADDLHVARFDPVPDSRQPFPALAPHAADHARAEAPDRQRLDLTLDVGLQQEVAFLAKTALRGREEPLSIAILIADHRSGAVLAAAGSAAYAAGRGQGFVDMTRAVRSPGSTLKPLVYALAFDQGLAHPDTLIDDRPVAFGSYAPQNFDGAFRGELKVAEALRQSLNIPVVLLTEELGPPRLMAALRVSGADPKLPGGKPGLAVALGGVGVTLWDLVQLYGGLANGGQAIALHQSGTSEAGGQIVSRAAAWQVGQILAELPPPRGAAHWRIAYKTGTSYGHRDAWAIGYDGEHVIGVWIGRPDGTPVPGVFGGDLAAPVLFEAFQRLKPAPAPLPPPPPETLILGTAALPEALQRFRGRRALFEHAADAPKLAFPPNGARIDLAGSGADMGLVAKLRDGQAPFTWLANGAPVLVGSHAREVDLGDPGSGFVTLTVIDAKGRSDRVVVRVE